MPYWDFQFKFLRKRIWLGKVTPSRPLDAEQNEEILLSTVCSADLRQDSSDVKSDTMDRMHWCVWYIAFTTTVCVSHQCVNPSAGCKGKFVLLHPEVQRLNKWIWYLIHPKSILRSPYPNYMGGGEQAVVRTVGRSRSFGLCLFNDPKWH